jgi:hypothetical protein
MRLPNEKYLGTMRAEREMVDRATLHTLRQASNPFQVNFQTMMGGASTTPHQAAGSWTGSDGVIRSTFMLGITGIGPDSTLGPEG